MKIETIPKLEYLPKIREARAYLLWLAFSEFNYHIDDDPTDMLWGEEQEILHGDVGILLATNMEAVNQAFKIHYNGVVNVWSIIWGLYGEACQWKHFSDSNFKELCQGYSEEVHIMSEKVRLLDAVDAFSAKMTTEEIIKSKYQ
jgi:hypothetical protein